MRHLFCLLLVLLQSTVEAQSLPFKEGATIYLVRHAEKMGGNDPGLTPDGHVRAGALLRALQHKGIKRIYVTEYKRTQQTADSLRIQEGIDVVQYRADTTGNSLLQQLKSNGEMGKSFLVIGHSNTLPFLVRRLGITEYPIEYIPDNEYDNLFIVTFRHGKATLTKERFGKKGGASAKMQ